MHQTLRRQRYRSLARNIDSNEKFVVPDPITYDELEDFMIEFGVLE